MLRSLLLLIVAASFTLPAAASTCRSKRLRPATFEIVKPLLELRAKQLRSETGRQAIQRSPSALGQRIDQGLARVLTDRSPVGDEALAYLLNIQWGEVPEQELVCEAVNRGARMVNVLRRFEYCLTLGGLAPLPPHMISRKDHAHTAVRRIVKGQGCAHDS